MNGKVQGDYKTEFPADVLPPGTTIPADWQDESWHNDSGPKWRLPGTCVRVMYLWAGDADNQDVEERWCCYQTDPEDGYTTELKSTATLPELLDWLGVNEWYPRQYFNLAISMHVASLVAAKDRSTLQEVIDEVTETVKHALSTMDADDVEGLITVKLEGVAAAASEVAPASTPVVPANPDAVVPDGTSFRVRFRGGVVRQEFETWNAAEVHLQELVEGLRQPEYC